MNYHNLVKTTYERKIHIMPKHWIIRYKVSSKCTEGVAIILYIQIISYHIYI